MLFKRILKATLLSCAAVSMAASAATATHAEKVAPQGVALDAIAAVVNDGVVLQSRLQAAMGTAVQRLNAQGTPVPPTRVLRHQVLQQLITMKLQLEEADRFGVNIGNQQLTQVIARIAKQRGYKLSQMPKVLAQQGLSYKQFRNQIRRGLTIRQVRQKAVASQIKITPAEVQHYLAAQAKQGHGNSQYHVMQIVLDVPQDTSPADAKKVYNKAQSLYKKLVNGANFSAVAVAHSNGNQALEGGDLGWLRGGELPISLADTILNMSPGDISKPIKDSKGYHIIKLADKRANKKVVITQTHARHILIKTNLLVSSKDAQKRLNDIREKVLHGGSFAKLAEKYSDDPGSAQKGGDLGWVSPGQMVPNFQTVMDKLKPHQISQPFKTRFGWHIVQVLDRRKQNKTQDVEKQRAWTAIHNRKLKAQTARWLQQLHDQAYISIKLNNTGGR